MARTIVVQISGMDGSGKSTIAKTLYHLLEREKLPVVRTWFRFPYFFSVPLLLLMRIIGLTKVYNIKNKTFTIHFFAQIGKIFTVLYVLDFTIYYILKYKLKTIVPTVLLSDRGPLDNLVDLLVDVESIRINPLFIKYFVKLQAKGLTILANCNYNILIRRRPEANIDPKYKTRFIIYKVLLLRHQALLRPVVVNTERDIKKNEKLLTTISRTVRLNYGHLGLSKYVENKYLKAILASKISLGINWIFQGVGIADTIENVFRFLLDFMFFIIAYLASGNLLISILVLVIAHTINYFINSNGPRIQAVLNKRTDIQYSLQRIKDYVKSNPPGRSVEAIVVFGSVVAGSFSKYSDIDMRVVRRKGVTNAWLSLVWTMKLRLYMWRWGIPSDVFIATREKLIRTVKSYELKNLSYIWQS
ncbi:MAG: nucleotidyltransferase domain-containing protein [Candidatus Methanomethylicia archaeon]